MITVDASVWIALLDKADVFHVDTLVFMQHVEQRRLPIFAPDFAILEIGCALARRQRDGAKGLGAATSVRNIPDLRLLETNAAFLVSSLRVGTECFLRGAEALYVATAEQTASQLITWDAELAARASGITPTAWLTANS